MSDTNAESIISFFNRPFRNHDFHYLHLEYDGEDNEPMHIHDFYEMYMVHRGHIEYVIEGSHYILEPYDVIITNPREMHMPIYKDRAFEISFVSFRRNFLPDSPTDTFNPYKPFDARRLGHGNRIEAKNVKKYGIDKIFMEIEEKLREDAPENEFFVRTKLMQLLLAVGCVVENTEGAYTTNETISQIITYINHNLEKDLRSEVLGKQFFVDSKYLRQLFRTHTGYSVSDYVKNKRIIKAQELIRRGMGTHAAAAAVGFTEYTTFFRAYKKITGTAPSSK